MSSSQNTTEFDHILSYLEPTITTLQALASGFTSPILAVIANTSQSLLQCVREVKRNKAECVRLLEAVCLIIHALIQFRVEGGVEGKLSTSMLTLMGNFVDSSSISLLPAEPKIFHGREQELATLLGAFSKGSPRLVILGPGGMGKTSLAHTLLHHPDIVTRYHGRRFFIPANKASSKNELVGLIGEHLGLRPAKDATKAVIQNLTTSTASLLLLDNLETCWESIESRRDVENFLSLLSEVEHVALMVTMRGAERPAQVKWTRPFLEPLQPLGQIAAEQTFIDIAGEHHKRADVEEILQLTDNLPLAIHLMAHVVESEGSARTLARWNIEKTAMVSDGYDKKTSLEISISLSLSSPRILSAPDSLALLSVLAILPDGLSDQDFAEVQISFQDGPHCRRTLLRTSLAYLNNQRRMKLLIPVQEYIREHYPVEGRVFLPVLEYYSDLVDANNRQGGTVAASELVPRIRENFVNIQHVIQYAGKQNLGNISRLVKCSICLSVFGRTTGLGRNSTFEAIPHLLTQAAGSDPVAHILYITQRFNLWRFYPIEDPLTLIQQTDTLLLQVRESEPKVVCRLYGRMGEYYRLHKRDITTAHVFQLKALDLATALGEPDLSQTLRSLAQIEWSRGNYPAALKFARDSRHSATIGGRFLSQAMSLRMEAIYLQCMGSYTTSLALCTEARHLVSLCGITGGETDNALLDVLGEIHISKSEYTEARAIQLEIAKNVSAETDPFAYIYVCINLAQLAILTSAPVADVHRHLEEIISISQRIDYSRGKRFRDIIFGDLLLREGDSHTARTIFEFRLTETWGLDSEHMAYCLERLGNANLWSSMESSDSWTIVYLAHGFKSQSQRNICKATLFLGDRALRDGDFETAEGLLYAALEGFTWMDVHQGRGDCMLRLGDIYLRNGRRNAAVGYWNLARPLFEKSSQSKQVRLIDERLRHIAM
ncbi:hypothetical protein K438DRAFT_1954196 [Mycena galopus ATCC 62051]|nr:hypothetical protein K438DRAFT_1954196 [Mycena galopus ATCC 62051]